MSIKTGPRGYGYLFADETSTNNADNVSEYDAVGVRRGRSLAAGVLATILLMGGGTGVGECYVDISSGITTSGVVQVHDVDRRRTNELATQLQHLKETTGLSWNQVAALFGVTRRAVHFWIRGGNITDDHLARLDHLQTQLFAHVSDDPRSTRAALMLPDATGRSPWSRLLSDVASEPSFSALDRLGSVYEQDDDF
jgi:hypothetical protein